MLESQYRFSRSWIQQPAVLNEDTTSLKGHNILLCKDLYKL